MNDQGKGDGGNLTKDSENRHLSTDSTSVLALCWGRAWGGGCDSWLGNKETTVLKKQNLEDKDAVHYSTNNDYGS